MTSKKRVERSLQRDKRTILRRPKALQDAIELWMYIATDRDEIVADAVIDHLDRNLEMLSHYPHIGRARPELLFNLRSYPIGRYVVFYFSLPDGIDIIRILDGRRDIPSILSQENKYRVYTEEEIDEFIKDDELPDS